MVRRKVTLPTALREKQPDGQGNLPKPVCELVHPEFHVRQGKQYLLRACGGLPTYLRDLDFWFMTIQFTSIIFISDLVLVQTLFLFSWNTTPKSIPRKGYPPLRNSCCRSSSSRSMMTGWERFLVFFDLPVAKDFFRVRSLYISYPISSTPPSDTQSAITLARAAIVLQEWTEKKLFIIRATLMYIQKSLLPGTSVAASQGLLAASLPSIPEMLTILRMDGVTNDKQQKNRNAMARGKQK